MKEEKHEWVQIGEHTFLKSEYEFWKKLGEEWEAAMLWGIKPARWENLPPEDNRKWALIKRAGSEDQELLWVDNKTMKAYERNGYERTDIEIPEFTFVRWARGMDL